MKSERGESERPQQELRERTHAQFGRGGGATERGKEGGRQRERCIMGLKKRQRGEEKHT